LLSEKMSPLVFHAIQQQILDLPMVVRDYQLFMHISKRRDDPEYVDVPIHERYRLCNESPETRTLPISCSIDLDYEDRFVGANRLTEIIIVKDSRTAGLPEATYNGLITLREEELEQRAKKRGQTVAFEVSTPEVAPGADVLVLRSRIKVQRAIDTNFWRAAQPMESVELAIEHDEDLEVDAFLVEPWKRGGTSGASREPAVSLDHDQGGSSPPGVRHFLADGPTPSGQHDRPVRPMRTGAAVRMP